ncbi:helix-turn-helix domain-containing protein [Halorubrum pallidum]|uniref:Helix-turn-helix domain-containing protein n=1 Tax=Halorubrum pallidum TaxID=1526114 RepID=A0ABD5SZR6_9EURY
MPQARLLVHLPDGPWIADISRRFPDTGFRVLTAVPDDDAGFALLRITSRTPDDVIAAMRSHPALAKASVMARDGGVATVRIETDAPLLLLAAKRSGLPMEMPLDIEDGVAEVEVTGEHERVAELGRSLRELGLEFDVERVRQHVTPGRTLTDRQRELLFTAVDLGYYEVPRRTTLTEVADHVGIAKSTCSETLQRVERTVIGEFVDGLPRRPEAAGDAESADAGAKTGLDREATTETETTGDAEAVTARTR